MSAIQTEQDYELAMAELTALMEADPAAGTLEAEWLRTLGADVEAYEREHYPEAYPEARS